MQFSPIACRRGNGSTSPKTFRTKYTVFNLRNETIPVCLKTFLAITRYSKYIVLQLANRYHRQDGNVEDRRGGFRTAKKFERARNSIMAFTNSPSFLESHYCRSQTQRKYLPSELSMAKLYRLYKRDYLKEEDADLAENVKLSYFRYVFLTEFNISFKLPHTDACSSCLQFKERIKNWPKNDLNNSEYVMLRAQYEIHKKRAKAFYSALKEYNPNELIFSSDCQKNLPMPKLPDGATYYSRQIYYQNFTSVSGNSHTALNPESVTAYIWTENQYQKNSNLISSCLLHRLRNIPKETWTNNPNINRITLASDGCAGQNKNSAMIAMAAYWLSKEAPPQIKEVKLLYPVTGHSFIPPDRVFAQIEKVIRHRETLVTVNDFDEIVAEYSTICKVSEAVTVYDFKAVSQATCKAPAQLHFQISQCKRIYLKIDPEKCGNVLIRGEPYYNVNTGSYASLFKMRKTAVNLLPTMIEERNVVKQSKKIDVNKLLIKHYGVNWRKRPDLQFYAKILGTEHIPTTCTTIDDEADEDDLCEVQEPEHIEELLYHV